LYVAYGQKFHVGVLHYFVSPIQTILVHYSLALLA
jgi:hypothetical protein